MATPKVIQQELQCNLLDMIKDTRIAISHDDIIYSKGHHGAT